MRSLHSLIVWVIVIRGVKSAQIEDLITNVHGPQHHYTFKSNISIKGTIGSLIQSVHGTDTYLMLKENLDKFNFKTTNVTTPCMLAAVKLIDDILNNTAKVMTLPGAKMIDAWAKLPPRFLLGNMMWMGAYDECTDTPDAKYCVTPFIIQGAPPGTMLTYGSCFPSACTNEDVAKVMSFLKVSVFTPIASASKCAEPVTYPTGTTITIVIMSLVLLLNVFGTFIDFLLDRKASQLLETNNSSGIDNKTFDSTVIPNHSVQSLENVDQSLASTKSPAANKGSTTTPRSTPVQILTCFSLHKNIESLLSTHVAPGAITSINGIRFFSMTWVVLGHYYAFHVLANSPDNILKALKVTQRFTFQAVANAYLSVDSFFLLSGLLAGYLTFKKLGDKMMKLWEIPMMYLHRYIRLTPTLGLVILFETNIYPNILSGPGKVVREAYADMLHTPSQQQNCYNYWWSTLLYFNNLYPENPKNCFGLAWYLANDFQFFALSPFIIMTMIFIHRNRSKGRAILFNLLYIGGLCSISILITGIITGVYNIPSLLTATLIPGNPRINQKKWIMERLYVKPYTRVTPYLVGIFLGYLFNKKVELKGKNAWLISVCGWGTAVLLASIVIYGPYSVFKQGGKFFTDGENIMYSATHRFLWSCALAWVIYASHYKFGGWVDAFLSWKVWIPISRLTYGGYLLHMLVMGFFMQIREVPYHYQDSMAVQDFISIIVVTYGFSFVLALLVEYPILKLEKIIFRR